MAIMTKRYLGKLSERRFRDALLAGAERDERAHRLFFVGEAPPAFWQEVTEVVRVGTEDPYLDPHPGVFMPEEDHAASLRVYLDRFLPELARIKAAHVAVGPHEWARKIVRRKRAGDYLMLFQLDDARRALLAHGINPESVA